jgi:hypothetical protein
VIPAVAIRAVDLGSLKRVVLKIILTTDNFKFRNRMIILHGIMQSRQTLLWILNNNKIIYVQSCSGDLLLKLNNVRYFTS